MARTDLERWLARASTLHEACTVVADHLAATPAFKPSVYLERGGRLRCQAARTYRQVFDGIPPDVGVIGRTYATGVISLTTDVATSTDYLEITPNVRAEICVPIRVSGRVVGVVSVESHGDLDGAAADEVTGCAAALGARLEQLGGGLQETPAQRLVRHATRLTDTKSRRRVEREVLEAAADVAEMDTAALLVTGADSTVSVIDAIGSLEPAITAAPQEALQAVAGFVAAGTSCFTVPDCGGEVGEDFKGLAMLRDAGAGSLAILSLAAVPSRVLVVADSEQRQIGTDTIELLELLCAHAASALRVSDLVKDLRVQAATDPLTGLGHHRAFHARLQAAPTSRSVAVLVVDLDCFKAVNDSEGHLAGDRLLREVAAVMQAAVRDHDELFRIGGDEFAVLAQADDDDEAREIATRLVKAVRATTTITTSVGVGVCGPAETLTQTLLRADRALYEAKAAGRDTVVLARPE